MSTYSATPIIDEVLHIRPCKAAEADHFVICKGHQLRYIIAKGGETPLVRCVVSYGGKAALLLKLLAYLPKWLLTRAKLGFWAQVSLHETVQAAIPQGHRWNTLVGTYCEKQKLVFQCFETTHGESLFVKVGNAASEHEMQAEMRFLQQGTPTFREAEIPQLTQAVFRTADSGFNIMTTREFHGEKEREELTADIIAVWREIAAVAQEGTLEFSHGDFAPWNLRRKGEHHIVFDWEHCGMKPHGYDLLYWGVVTRLARRGMNFDAAYEDALAELRHYDVHPAMTKEEFYRLFTEVITPDGF